MARSVLASGAQAATVNTEHVLKGDSSNECSVIDGKISMGNMGPESRASRLDLCEVEKSELGEICESSERFDAIDAFNVDFEYYVPALSQHVKHSLRDFGLCLRRIDLHPICLLGTWIFQDTGNWMTPNNIAFYDRHVLGQFPRRHDW